MDNMSPIWDNKLPVGLRFMVTKTTKGRLGLIIGQHKFRKSGIQKDGTLIFRCSLKDCPARVNLDAAMRRVLKIRMNHNHPGRDLSDIINVRLPAGLTASEGQAEEAAKIGRISGGPKSAEREDGKVFTEDSLTCRILLKLFRDSGKDQHTILLGMGFTTV